MRLFTAIELPADVREQLAWAARAIHYKISLVREANLHVTLKFLGEVPEPKVAELCEAFKGFPDVGPVSLRAEKVECFPQRGPIRVIAIGLGGDTARLVQLYKNFEQGSERYGIPPERRPYCPHITIARARNPLPADRRHNLEMLMKPSLPGAPFEANEFVLMQSHLKRDGPEYIRLATFPLSGANPD